MKKSMLGTVTDIKDDWDRPPLGFPGSRWLRLHAPTAGGMGFDSGLGTRILHAMPCGSKAGGHGASPPDLMELILTQGNDKKVSPFIKFLREITAFNSQNCMS